AVIKPDLAIMDGIVGMEGDGPAAGPPRKIGVVLASQDLVALDAVASHIIGYAPSSLAAFLSPVTCQAFSISL
ncbi:unnamed protein product, partial [marine sediment metagenome]